MTISTNLISSVNSSRDGDIVALELLRDGVDLGTIKVKASDAGDYICRFLGAADASELRSTARFDGSARWVRCGAGDVWMTSFGDRKINVIKALRERFHGMGLKEAKDMVEASPVCIATNLAEPEAKSLAEHLRSVGATVEVRA